MSVTLYILYFMYVNIEDLSNVHYNLIQQSGMLIYNTEMRDTQAVYPSRLLVCDQQPLFYQDCDISSLLIYLHFKYKSYSKGFLDSAVFVAVYLPVGGLGNCFGQFWQICSQSQIIVLCLLLF